MIAGVSVHTIEQHPAILAARAAAAAIPLTDKHPGYGTPEWRNNRQFANGLTGYRAAVNQLNREGDQLC
jgi:hypothetical protein